jgi:ubiquinone/menaquinone biosynthesis C-methylase UbiE
MTYRHRPLVVVGLVALLTGVVCAQNNAADTKRLIEHLDLAPGDIVAEIGAGNGDLTVAIARHVGDNGRVFTSEMPSNLERLRGAVTKRGLQNITVVEAQVKEANLPDACCDALFLRNVYHHFSDTATMNASFLRALKPGGRIAVIDFPPRRGGTAAAGKRSEDSSHGVANDVVVQELTAAGFRIVPTPEADSAGSGTDRWFMIVGEKPVQ